jgi:hypothetical protein
MDNTYGEEVSEELSSTLAKNMASFISSMPLRALEDYFSHFTAWSSFVLKMFLELFDLTFPYLQSLTIRDIPCSDCHASPLATRAL